MLNISKQNIHITYYCKKKLDFNILSYPSSGGGAANQYDAAGNLTIIHISAVLTARMVVMIQMLYVKYYKSQRGLMDSFAPYAVLKGQELIFRMTMQTQGINI